MASADAACRKIAAQTARVGEGGLLFAQLFLCRGKKGIETFVSDDNKLSSFGGGRDKTSKSTEHFGIER